MFVIEAHVIPALILSQPQSALTQCHVEDGIVQSNDPIVVSSAKLCRTLPHGLALGVTLRRATHATMSHGSREFAFNRHVGDTAERSAIL